MVNPFISLYDIRTIKIHNKNIKNTCKYILFSYKMYVFKWHIELTKIEELGKFWYFTEPVLYKVQEY